jgi:hypothetical protein
MRLHRPVGRVIEPKVKGVAIREFVWWYGQKHGQERLSRAVTHMRAAERSLLVAGDAHLGVISSDWYAAATVHALLDALTLGASEAERQELAREGAQAAIQATLRGVYRLLFQAMMSPDRYARDAQKLFSRYYNTGLMEKTATSPTSHRSVVREWTSHHPLLCDFILYTGIYVYGAMGCRDVALKKTACVSRGDRECVFTVDWK